MEPHPAGLEETTPLDHLVAKVLAGEATPEELEVVRQSLAVAGHGVLTVEALAEATRGLQALPVPPGFDAPQLWRRLCARLEARQGAPEVVAKRRAPISFGAGIAARRASARRFPVAAWAVAAAAIVVAWAVRVPRHQVPPSVTTYATRNGQRAEISLPDGSTASLDVGSRLEVPSDFGHGDRTVHLTGEALFTVAHHPGQPFTVLANGVETHVLGTTFLVRHYATDTATMVAVREGRVAVAATVVSAGQQVTVSSDGRPQVALADSSAFTFTRGVLTLNGVSLSDAVVELDRWYDADIRLADPSLSAHRIKATCVAGSLADLAAVLEFTLDVRVVRSGRVLTLYPKAI